MSPLDRRIRIERSLADWFRRDGWSVSGNVATKWAGGYDGEGWPTGDDIEVDISRLADFLEEETRAFA